ncbi:MAG: CsgG/HfaB family protein [Sedimentisphaerales bacterium]
MKKIASIIALCLLAAAVVTAGDAPGAEQNPAGSAASKRSASNPLLKTEPNNAVIREVIGRGRNRDEAVKNALYRAVEQVRGVRVDSSNYEFGFRSSGVGVGDDGPGRRRIEFDSVDVATDGTVYTTEIGGLVRSYNVLDEKQIDQNTYEVTLQVAVYDYGARGQTGRVKIALMPAKTQQDNYGFLNQIISGDTLSSLFSQRLIAGLTQTNKFAVLDRESIVDFTREKEMLFSFDAPLGEQAKLAETLGADYLLVGTISQAEIERFERYLKAANYTSRKFKARFNFDYRLVDSSTKQVVLATTAQKYLEDEQVRKLADEQNPAEWDSAQVRDAFISLVANDVIAAVIDRVYPIAVAAVQGDGQLILNQGGQRMKNGMLLDVYTTGKEIFDNDTGESLGSIESHVATIEIQKVAYTMSMAKVVAGDVSKVPIGSVCRIQKQKRDLGVGMEPDIIRTKTGGVKLPFDN